MFKQLRKVGVGRLGLGYVQLWVYSVDHVDDRVPAQLSRVLVWRLLRGFEEAEEAFLFGVEVYVLAELAVDLLPHLVLREGVKAAHFWGLGRQSAKTHTEVFFHQSGVKLLQCEHVPLVMREQLHVVLEHWDCQVPQVEVLGHVLQYLWLEPYLRILESYYLFEHGSCKLSLVLNRVDCIVLNHILGHLVEIES